MTTIAYLGPPGTWSEVAARGCGHVGATLLPVSTLSLVVQAIEMGSADVGVLPIENALEGTVTTTLDLLIHETELQIQAEIVVPIEHALLAKQGTQLRDIQRVWSHPQALAQCRQYLERMLPQATTATTASTVAGVERALNDQGAAAIAPSTAADLYPVVVVADAIQDSPTNATRFVVLGSTDAIVTGNDKTSFAFRVAQVSAGVLDVLQAFERNGVALTKLESRPSRERLGQYIFVADLVGHREQTHVAAALQQVAAGCSWFKLLGSYPKWSILNNQ